MSPQDPQAAALLAHVVSQMENNVNFLVAQNYISQADASAIMTKLPNPAANNSSISSIASRVSNMTVRSPPPPMPRAASATPSLPQGRAMWAYTGDDPNDLSFAAGDIIEIVEETSSDWWMGRINGKQGLVPSAYLERLQHPVQDIALPAPKAYKPFGAAYHGVGAQPPPPSQGVNSVGLQEDPEAPAKKDKFGKYKSTLAQSAAGGVGFGAGAAIGGGLVRAIF